MSHDAIENISQRYISRLTTDSTLAQNDVKNAVAQLDISSKALALATEWKGVIETYWVNVKKSNNAYLEVEGFLNQLESLAKTVTKNGGIVAESIETLVCVVREMSLSTDKLKNKVRDLKNRLTTADANNTYLKKIKDFELKIEDATKANATAIRSVLDLLKQAYLMRVSLEGRISVTTQIEEKLADKWCVLEVGNDEWMEFYHKITIIKYLVEHDRSLAQSVHWLSKLLKEDNAYELKADEASLLPLTLPPIGHVPTFPLSKETYYSNTEKAFMEADMTFKKAESDKKKAEINSEAKKARLDAISAALKAATEAKKATTV